MEEGLSFAVVALPDGFVILAPYRDSRYREKAKARAEQAAVLYRDAEARVQAAQRRKGGE